MKPFHHPLLEHASEPLTREQERELSERSLAGDVEATHRLMTSQIPWVFEITIVRVRKRSDHDEAFSIGLAGLVKALRRYDPARGRLSTFTVLAVRSEFWRVNRKKRVKTSSLNAPDAEGRTPANALRDHRHRGPADSASKAELHDRLREAISQLPAKERVTIRRRLAGRTRSEVADELQTSPAYIKQVEQRAIDRLREALSSTAESI